MNRSKPTDFASALSDYLFRYLPDQKGRSEKTIQSYSDAFMLFLTFCENELHIRRERLEIKDITCERVENYLDWLERERHNSIGTRNLRRAAFSSFFKYLQYKSPKHILLFQQIKSIPHKTDKHQTVKHLSREAVEEILKKPNLQTSDGRRDFAVLSLLYETAARVSEVVDLCIGDVRFERSGTTVRLFGKGRKERDVPIISDVAAFLKRYLADEEHRRTCSKNDPLFCNRVKGKLTRGGVSYVLDKYVDAVRLATPDLLPERVYPHILRHSRAMHWLEAGIDLQYIKDLLGVR